jgi:8-oxo-dGTP pyrophosphatase MutT (NUDIX family)
MTIQPPATGEPRRPHGARDSGDAWVEAPTGERYWGRYGAAGLLAVDRARGVLLQHRVAWSHFGGTWALPGGARHEGESATDAAIREATEEAGVPDGSVRPRLLGVLDLGFWSYTTLVADVVESFEPVISDPESIALAWVPIDEIDRYPLHPGFADSWATLRGLLGVRPVVVVDAANVVGSVPDGWWRDRAGATTRLLDRVDRLAAVGVSAVELGLAAERWFPEFVVVREGQAREAEQVAPSPYVRTADAAGSGDDEIVAQAEAATASGATVTVVTSDRALAERCVAVGATVRGAGWLLALLED